MTAFVQQRVINLIALEVQRIMDHVNDELIREYEEQGHKLTGALANTMRVEITKLTDGVMGIIYMNDYYKVLDTGVSAARIPFEPNSGRKNSKYIEGLIRYFKIRLGLDEKGAKKRAFKSAYTHKREGMPSKGSYAFSKNGRRTNFFTNTIKANQQRIQTGVEAIFGQAIRNALEEINQTFRGEIVISL